MKRKKIKFKKFDKKNLFISMHSRYKNCYVEWYVGNICNQRCSYCLNGHTYNQYYHDMTKDQTDKVIDFINSLPNVCRVDIIGGEPSCFEHIFYAIDNIKLNCSFGLMSNGQDEKFVEEYLSRGTQKRRMLICISAHYEMYLKDKKGFLEHLDRLIALDGKYKHSEMEFAFLLDKEKTKEYTELIEHLYYEAKKKRGINLVTSYVRRTRDAKEVVKNFAATNYFDGEVREFLQEDLKGERTNFLRCNEFLGEYCPIYTNYIYIRVDGKLDATSCEQEIVTNKSIFDDDFDLEEEKRLLKQKCHCKHKPNNGGCGHVHGKHFGC